MIDNFYIRASKLSQIMAGSFGLTERQEKDLEDLEKRERGELLGKNGKALALTDSMKEELDRLRELKANPRLTQGAISNLKKIVYQYYYGLQKDVYSKELEHGNWNEQISINTLNAILEIGLEKYEGGVIYDDEIMLSGTPDIITDNFVIDIKNPWDYETFNIKREEIELSYYWQLQAYMYLTKKDVSYLVYTLNLNKYMQGDEYDHLSHLDRIIVKKIDYDETAIAQYKERVPAIREALKDIIEEFESSFKETREYLIEIKRKAPAPLAQDLYL